MKSFRLREGKERSLLRRHPWVFQGSIAGGKADAGETVRIEAADGRFLAWGAYSPTSMIRVRAWSFDQAERIDAAFFERRIARALALRARQDGPMAVGDLADMVFRRPAYLRPDDPEEQAEAAARLAESGMLKAFASVLRPLGDLAGSFAAAPAPAGQAAEIAELRAMMKAQDAEIAALKAQMQAKL